MPGGRFSVSAIFKLVDRMSRPVAKIQKRISRFARRAGQNLRQLNRGFNAIGRAARKAGLVIGAAAGAMGLAIGSVAKTGGDFEQAITNVGAVSLKSRAEIQKLEKQALALGASTKFTATEVANAQEIMARAGFEQEEILAGVPGVLDAAAASGLEMAEVANVVANSLRGFGMEANRATDVADILALASSKTNSTIGSLGESLKNVSATARQLGVPIEDATAAVALLQDVGLDASVAGSSLNTMLTKLAKPPAKLAREMKRMGISFKDAKGNMLPFQQVIGQISEASKKAGGNFDQVAFLADLVGLRGQKAAANLSKLFDDKSERGLEALTAQLQNASGAAAKMAAIRMDTFQGDMLKLGAAVDGVKIALFGIDSPLRPIVQGMTAWVDKNKELIVSGVQNFVTTLSENIGTIAFWLKKIGIVVGVFGTFALLVKAATAAMAIFNAVMALNPFVAIAMAVVALGALVAAFWPEITTGWQIVAESLRRSWDSAWNAITSALTAAAEFMLGVFATLFPSITSIVAGGVRFIVDNWDLIASSFVNAWQQVVAFAGVAVEAIKQAFTPVVEFFNGIWRGVAEGFRSILGGVLSRLSSVIDKARSIGGSVLKAAGFGGGDSPAAPSASAAPSLVSPSERVSREISESTVTNRDEMLISIADESGRASVPRPPQRASVELMSSGEF